MTFRQLKQDEVLPAGAHWIGVTKGMSGYFAVDYWMNGKDIPNHVFPEPWDIGMGRYATIEQAKAEALEWAKAEELPYSFPVEYPRSVDTHIWEIGEGIYDFSDETENLSGGIYTTIKAAQAALDDYCAWLNQGTNDV
jgi:hypothetical protein